MGRIATIKMTILPRIIFLFQTISIILKQTFSHKQNKIITKFICKTKQKKTTMKLKALQNARENAGFGLRDWESYYKTCAMVWIREWITIEDKR